MKLLVWGANSCGQLGIGLKSELVAEPIVLSQSRLKNLPDLKDVVSLYGGGGHSLVLTNDGRVYGCGWNKAGQLLTNDIHVLDFIKLSNFEKHKILQIATCWDSCFAVTEEGLCLGWGSNAYGQFGFHNDKVKEDDCPFILSKDVKQVQCGARHSVILHNNGTVSTAGDRKFGKLGRDPKIHEPGFGQVLNLKNIKEIACGFNHTVALSEDGKFFVWGCNKWGQLGKDPKPRSWIEYPEELCVQENISSIHAGWSSTHLLTRNGIVLNFGRNNYGQLGQTDSCGLKPWEIHVLNNIQKLSVGSEHAVALTGDGNLVSWGWNEHGSCGNGNIENQFAPTPVKIDKAMKARNFVAASGHNFVLCEEEQRENL